MTIPGRTLATIFSKRRKTDGRLEPLIALCRELLSERGDVSGARLAVQAAEAYRGLRQEDVGAFFDWLARDLAPDVEAVRRAAHRYIQQPDAAELAALQQVVESPRLELFRRLNMAPGGTALLIAMRRHLLAFPDGHPARTAVADDLLHLFRSWFNRGFLVLQRIDWRTPAVTLERLIEYEAVHQIQGWRDLRRRLEVDRRCYAFFHPVLPDDPLIFIEVALTHGISSDVRPLIDPKAPVEEPSRADTAIFYSITNCQEGLRGVSFGNELIKQVVEDLGREFPRVRTFATLSPIPGFRRWLVARDPLWEAYDVGEATASTRRELTALCAHYLLNARRNDEPLDPVARFHLANGATLERVNWMADPSAAGIERSFGLMANYVYRPEDLERNHEAYARKAPVIASREIHRLARATP